MEDETREMTPEEIKAAEEAEKKEVERVQEARRRCGQAVAQVLQVLEPLIDCGDVARVLDTVEAFYCYTPLDRAKAFVAESFQLGAPLAAQLMPIALQFATMFDQPKPVDHAAKQEALQHMQAAAAQAKREAGEGRCPGCGSFEIERLSPEEAGSHGTMRCKACANVF